MAAIDITLVVLAFLLVGAWTFLRKRKNHRITLKLWLGFFCLFALFCKFWKNHPIKEQPSGLKEHSTPHEIKPQGIATEVEYLEPESTAGSENSVSTGKNDTPGSSHSFTTKAVQTLSNVRYSAGFFENKGQFKDDQIKYVLRRKGLDVVLGATEFTYIQRYSTFSDEGTKHHQDFIQISLIGAHPKNVTGLEPGGDVHNYMISNGPFLDVHHYEKVVYNDVYPGIDMLFESFAPHADQASVKYSFIVHPGADPNQIKLAYSGQLGLAFKDGGAHIEYGMLPNDNRKLAIMTGAGEIIEELTEIYTVDAGQRLPVEGGYQIENKYVGVQLDAYDNSKTLVIDPTVSVLLRRATYYGSEGTDRMNSISADSEGNIFVIGTTPGTAVNMSTSGTFDQSINGANDMIIAKFNPDLSQLLVATYFGGDNEEDGISIALDGEENVYVSGYTISTDLPTEDPDVPYTSNGGEDIVVARFNNELNSLQWLQAFGGSSNDRVNDLAIDGDNLVAVGTSASRGLNTIGGNLSGDTEGISDIILFRLEQADGSRLWSKYYGDNQNDEGFGIALYEENIYMTGLFFDTDIFNKRAFIASHDLDGNLLLERNAYGRFIHANDIAVSTEGDFLAISGIQDINGAINQDNAQLVNLTSQEKYGGGSSDGFVVKVNASDLSVDWSAYFGGENNDKLQSILIDCNDNILVAGNSRSENNIADDSETNGYNGGGNTNDNPGDAVMAKFSKEGQRLWGYYFGATADERGLGITLGQNGEILLCGATSSQTGITTTGVTPVVYDEIYSNGGKGGDVGFLSTFCDLIIDEVPQSQTVTLGSDVSFSVGTNFCGSIDGYSWTKDLRRLSDSGNISGSGTAQLDLVGVSSTDEGEYCVTISTTCGEQTLCAFLTIVSLSGNDVCLDSLTTAGNPSDAQESIMLTFPNLEDNASISNATYQWEVSAASGDVSGASEAVAGSNGTFPTTLPITDEDLYEIEISPSIPGEYIYSLTLNYEDSRRTPSAITDQISTTVSVYEFPTLISIIPNPVSICTEERTQVELTSDIDIANIVWELKDDAEGKVTISGGPSGTIRISPAATSATFEERFLLNSETTIAQTVTIQVTPFTGNGCPGPAWEFEVEVKPGPVIETVIAEEALCNNEEIVIDVSTLPDFAGTAFSWSRASDDDILPAPAVPGGTFTTEGQILETLENMSNKKIDVNYTISGDFDGCGPETSVQITILPTARPTLAAAQEIICSGASFDIAIGTNVTDLRSVGFKVMPTENDAITGLTQSNVFGFDQSRNYSFTGTLENSSNTLQEASYMITAYLLIDADTCFGATEPLIIPVQLQTNIVASNQSICSGETLSIPVSSGVTDAEISWALVPNSDVVVEGATSGVVNTSGTIDQVISLTDAGSLSGVDVMYDLTSSIAGCSGESLTVTVRVDPNPQVAISGDHIICGDSPVILNATSSLPDIDWQWFLGDDLIDGENSQTIEVSTAGFYTAMAMTSETSECTGEAEIEVIKQELVDVDPITANSNPNGVCAVNGVELFVEVSGTPAFQWQREVSGVFQDISGAQAQSYLALESGKYRVRINPDDICDQLSDEIEVDFAPVPDLSVEATDPLACSDEEITLTGIIVPNGATLTDTLWSISPEDAIISNGKTLNPTITFPANSTGASIDYDVYLLVNTDFGCKDSVKVELTLAPAPKAIFEIDQSICGGESLVVNNTSELTTDYLWSTNSAEVMISDTGSENPSITFPDNTGTVAEQYDIQLEVTSVLGCKDDTTIVVQVFPQPTMVIDGFNGAACSPYELSVNSSNLSNSNDGMDFARVEWFLNGVSQSTSEVFEGQLINTGATDRQFRLLLEGESSNGCVSSVFEDITVFPDGRAEFEATTTVGCAPFNINEGDNIRLTEYPDANKEYRWEVIADGTVVFNSEGIDPPVYTIEDPNLTVSLRLTAVSKNGCEDDVLNIDFSSFEDPEPSFNVTAEVCAGDIVDFTNVSTLTGGTALPEDAIVVWDFGDGSTSGEISPTHIFSINNNESDIVYEVQLSVTYQGCTKVESDRITVRPVPLAQFDLGNGCGSDLLMPNNNSIGKGDLSYRWTAVPPEGISFDNPAAANPEISISAVLSTDAEYQISLEVTTSDGCKSRNTESLVVFGAPEALIQSEPLLCLGENVLFESVVPIESSDLAPDSLYIWDYGDGVIDTVRAPNRQTEHIYSNTINYTLKLTVVNTAGCLDMTTADLSVIDGPQADFTKTLTSSNEVGGTILTTVEGKDEDEICGPFVAADFTDLSVIFDEGETYLWNFGRGENDTSTLVSPPTAFYEQNAAGDTTYIVTLVVTNQCQSDTIRDHIKILPIPTAAFNFQYEVGCDEVPVTIFNNSLGAPDTYTFDFGDGTDRESYDESNPIEHTFFAPNQRDTTYTILLITENMCGKDSTTRDIRVIPNDIRAAISIESPDDLFCQNEEITFIANGYIDPSARITWDFGDGTKEFSEDTVTHGYTEPGTYDVILELFIPTCGATSRATVTITIEPSPDIAFTSAQSICINQELTIENTGADKADNTIWDFGDGMFYEGIDPPAHQYETEGRYTITMSLANANGCETRLTEEIEVRPLPTAGFTIPEILCEEDLITFENLSDGAQSYLWEVIELNETKITENFDIVFDSGGVYTIRLTAFDLINREGCQHIRTQSIMVNEKPSPSFIISDERTCQDSTFTIINNSIGSLTDVWSLLDSDTREVISVLKEGSNVSTFDHAIRTPGQYTINLESTSLEGCVSSIDEPLDIIANPNIILDSLITEICQGYEYQYINKTVLPDSVAGQFRWYVDDALVSSNYQLFPQSFAKRQGENYSVNVRLDAQNDICVASDERDIVIPGYLGCNFAFPTAFSPNGDGQNDKAFIDFHQSDIENILSVKMQVYTITDHLIFDLEMSRSSADEEMRCLQGCGIDFDPELWYRSTYWEGEVSQVAEDNRGLYWYIIQVECCNREAPEVTGYIQLLR